MPVISLLILVRVLLCFLPCSAEQYCDTARHICMARTGCSMALHNFFMGCKDVITGESSVCTLPCKRALVSLLSTEDQTGHAFMNCNCNGSKYCDDRKRRVEICTQEVLDSMKDVDDMNVVVSCSQARWICEADTSCLTALTFYLENCQMLLEGHRCTPKCNNSLSILYRQSKSRKLQTCVCDGTENYDCHEIKDKTMRLCFLKNVPYTVEKPVDSRVPQKPHQSSDNTQRHEHYNSAASTQGSAHYSGINGVHSKLFRQCVLLLSSLISLELISFITIYH